MSGDTVHDIKSYLLISGLKCFVCGQGPPIVSKPRFKRLHNCQAGKWDRPMRFWIDDRPPEPGVVAKRPSYAVVVVVWIACFLLRDIRQHLRPLVIRSRIRTSFSFDPRA